jgi:hypothetical protein
MGFDVRHVSLDGQECMAEALTKIEGGLKIVTDPAVHSRDEENPGLLMLLEHSLARTDPTCDAATALEIAFELGQAAVAGKADPAVVEKLRGMPKAWHRGGVKGGGKGNKALATMWQKRAMPVYQGLRAEFPKESCRILAKRIIEKLGDILPGVGRVERWVGAMDKLRSGSV